MKTLFTFIIFLTSAICYSQQIITIADTTIKDECTIVAPAIIVSNSTFIEGSAVTLNAFVTIRLLPGTSIQGYSVLKIIPYRVNSDNVFKIFGREMIIRNGKKYMKWN